MDLLTHAALGAAAAAAVAPSARVRLAAFTGALAGVLPDADILITSSSDPLLTLEFHRHFTHSLLFVPIGAALAAAIAWLVCKRRLHYASFYSWALLGYVLAPLLDACTSYGTHLLWPFSERPVAWSIVSVIDPLFTVGLAVPLAMALVRLRPALARVSLFVAAAGLSVGAAQHQRALDAAVGMAASRGHHPERLFVKPTLANMVLWRSVYLADGTIYVDAIRPGLLTQTRIYHGEHAPRIDPERDLDLPVGSRARRDVGRFARFSEALIVRHPRRPQMIGDARYAMLPTSIEPLWGIELDPEAPDAPVRFNTTRRLDADTRARFLAMLFGRSL